MPWPQPSPFRFEGPLRADELRGRDEEVRSLLNLARAGRPAALVAPRRFGKTSLMNKLKAVADKDGSLIVVAVDLDQVGGVEDLSLRLQRAWSSLPAPWRQRVAEYLAGLHIDLAAGPVSLGLGLPGGTRPTPLETVSTLLGLPESRSFDRRVLVMMDEFQYLRDVDGAEGLLRSFVQRQTEVASYLFAGSEPSMMRAAFSDRSRPLYSQAQWVNLERLDPAAAAAAIYDGFRETGKSPGAQVAPLLEIGQLHPQRTMLLADRLWQEVPVGAVASPAELRNALEASLEAATGEVQALMGGLTSVERKTVRAVAEFGTPLSNDALEAFDARKSAAQSALRRLMNAAILEAHPADRQRRNGRWRTVDPMLSLWLTIRYPVRRRT